jgi:hypothetical protein
MNTFGNWLLIWITPGLRAEGSAHLAVLGYLKERNTASSILFPGASLKILDKDEKAVAGCGSFGAG